MQVTKNPDPAEQRADTVWMDVPASNSFLPVIEACVSELAAALTQDSDAAVTAYNMRLAVHEACTNIVDHGYGDLPDARIRVIVRVQSDPQRLVVELRDSAAPFDPDTVPGPDLDQPREHGYGLFLIRSLVDDFTSWREPEGNCWRLTKLLSAG